MHFDILGEITNIETIASGTSLREHKRLWKVYGKGRWRKRKGLASLKLADGTICFQQNYTGTKLMASARRNTKSSVSSNKRNHRVHDFVICIRNQHHLASLEVRKLYQVIRDTKASKHHLLRVVDESGEDYLYPEDYFVTIKLPEAAERAILRNV